MAVIELHHYPGFYDPVSAVTHLIGAVAFTVLGVLLVRRGRGNRVRVAFLSAYAFSCVLVLSMSGLYHMTAVGGAARPVLQRLDHSAIFGLIAGTFTVVHGLLFKGRMRWVPLAMMWVAAAAGVMLKSAYMDDVPEWAGLSAYLAAGWIGGISAMLLWRRHGFTFVRPFIWGGVVFSAGAALEFARWPVLIPGFVQPHEVFHLLVLAGAVMHYAFVWQFADGTAPSKTRRPAGSAGPGVWERRRRLSGDALITE